VIIAVTLANLASFLLPYLLEALSMMSEGFANDLVSGFVENLDSGPAYIVGFMYLVITLIVEIPIVYAVLNNRTGNRKKLLTTIILVNIATTLLVLMIERILCIGFMVKGK